MFLSKGHLSQVSHRLGRKLFRPPSYKSHKGDSLGGNREGRGGGEFSDDPSSNFPHYVLSSNLVALRHLVITQLFFTVWPFDLFHLVTLCWTFYLCLQSFWRSLHSTDKSYFIFITISVLPILLYVIEINGALENT